MKLLAIIHGYPNWKNSGAEWMVHEMFKFLVEKGHEVTVRVPLSELTPYVLDGVKIDRDMTKETIEDVKNCDAIITHLNRQGRAINAAEYFNKPVIVVHHNPHGFDPIRAKHKPTPQERWIYNIFNSEQVRRAVNYPNPYMILHPPVDPERVKVKKGTKVTLINCWPDKGGLVLQSLASLLPDKKFLGVKGGYAETDQVIAPNENVEYMDNTADIKRVYAKTKILIMPSIRESYGRVAVEAMINGIPVIAHPTEGLKECMGEAGIYLDRNNVQAWADKIKELDDPEKYKEASAKALKRAKEIEAERIPSLNEMETFIKNCIDKQL